MKTEEIEMLETGLRSLGGDVELLFRGVPENSLSAELRAFAETLCGVSEGKVRLRESDDSQLPWLPALTLSRGGRQNIHYHMVPREQELAPFLEGLGYFAEGRAPLSAEARACLSRLSSPVELIVFASPFCTQCPRMVGIALAMASDSPLVSASIVDVQHFEAAAAAYGIKSVPATIVDRGLVLLGQVPAERLSRLFEQRGTEPYAGAIYRSLIERGRVSDAADLFIQGKGRQALVDLFQERELAMRMGVLVVFDAVLDREPAAAREMLPALIGLLSHEDPRIRGDIADLLGRMGDRRAAAHLEKLVTDPDPDVAEAVADALEALRNC